MTETGFIRVGVLYAAVAICAPAPVARGGDLIGTVAVLLQNQAISQVVAAIADLGTSDKAKIEKGTALAKEIIARCGTLDPVYVSLFLKENRNITFEDLKSLQADTVVSFPACGRAPEGTATTIGPKQAIAQIASSKNIPLDAPSVQRGTRSSGSNASTTRFVLNPAVFDSLRATLDAIDRLGLDSPALIPWIRKYFAILNAQVVLSQDINPKKMQTGDTFYLPASSAVWSSVILKPGVDPGQATQRIEQALQASVTTQAPTEQQGVVEPSSFASLITEVGTDDPKAIGKCEDVETRPWNWPFDIGRLLQILALNGKERRLHQNELKDAKILILDSRIDSSIISTSAFPENYIARPQPLPSLKGPIKPVSGSSVLGVNLATNTNDPSSAVGFLHRFHGIGVAGAALGGSGIEALRQLLTPALMRIVFANVVSQVGTKFAIDPANVYQAFSFAQDNDISIINASLALTTKSGAFDDALTKYGSTILLVVAAGNEPNEPKSLGVEPAWPAAFGGDPANAHGAFVITVGAHDGVGNVTPFSRRGERFVDLLAPGCKVPTYTGVASDNDIVVRQANLSGTSFAAPIVSFVAGLLKREGLNAKQIKTRLITSVDERPELDHVVWSRGILDPWKALAIYNDVLEVVENGTIRIRVGHVTAPPSLLKFCGNDEPTARIRKLTLTKQPSGNSFAVRIWTMGVDPNHPEGMDRRDVCLTQEGDTLSNELQFIDSTTGEKLKMPIQSILEWVPPLWL
jgi:subtilisin family serine protease